MSGSHCRSYLGEDGKVHHYIPDFVIRRQDGRCLIVEIKDARFKAATEADLERADKGQAAITSEGRKAVAVRQWERLNADRLKYQLVFAHANTLAYDQIEVARQFVVASSP